MAEVPADLDQQFSAVRQALGQLLESAAQFGYAPASWEVTPDQAIEEFYRGKQIDLVIGYSPGGTYDLYARLVARHLGNFIPGKPRIVPRNMPGAGSRAAATWVYKVAPRNGTVLATADQSLSIGQALGDKHPSLSAILQDLGTRAEGRA